MPFSDKVLDHYIDNTRYTYQSLHLRAKHFKETVLTIQKALDKSSELADIQKARSSLTEMQQLLDTFTLLTSTDATSRYAEIHDAFRIDTNNFQGVISVDSFTHPISN